MKRSDTSMDAQTGKFIDHAQLIGTVTRDMVTQRAKEIAVINGRNGNDYTQDDFEAARRELVGFPETAQDDLENSAPDTGNWLAEAGDKGQRAPIRGASDEQTFAEDLVKQGVEESTHDQMLAGSQHSAAKDQI
jgi:hypothetical protein